MGMATIEHSVANARDFLRWQFGRGRADWSQVQANDIWDFAQYCARGVKPIYIKVRLGHLRRFLAFANLRGACPAELITAIPKIAVPGHSTRPQILSDRQQRELRASFQRTPPEGKRDYAMTLCMLDLGLRGCEVIGLRLQDIDWQGRVGFMFLQSRLAKAGSFRSQDGSLRRSAIMSKPPARRREPSIMCLCDIHVASAIPYHVTC